MTAPAGSDPLPLEISAAELRCLLAEAERTRDRAQADLAAICEQMSDAYAALDREWRYTYVSRKAAEMLGRRPEELTGKHIWTEFPAVLGEPFRHACERAVAEQTSVVLEGYSPSLRRSFESHIHPSAAGLSIFFQDTADRRIAQDAVRESEERLRLALEAARMGTFDWDLPNDRVVWSPGHELLFGFEPGEFGGTYAAFARRVHPDDLPAINAELVRCTAARAPFDLEFRIVRPDGSRHWVEGLGEFTFDESGQAIRMRGVVMDVSVRKQSEESLRSIRGELENAQALARLGSWELDPDNDRATWSREMFALTGFDPATAPPAMQTFVDWIHPDDRPTLREVTTRARSGTRQEFDMRTNPTNGPVRYLHVIMSGQTDDAGRVCLSGTTQDVTEHYRTRQENETSRAELRRLAASLITAREEERARIAREIHDECGQMLTGVKMDAAWLARHLPADGGTFQVKIAAMGRLIDGAVQAVRQISTELRPGLLDDLGLAAAIEWQAEQFSARTGIPCHVDAVLPTRELGPHVSITVFRIFQESLTNVARHAGAHRVDARLEQIGQDLVLQVRDNGRGITEDDIRNSRSIGIVGMRERALVVGGTLSVTGRPGDGTTVEVRIPLGDPPAGDR